MYNTLKKRMFRTILHAWDARDEGVLSKVYSKKICIALVKIEKMEKGFRNIIGYFFFSRYYTDFII